MSIKGAFQKCKHRFGYHKEKIPYSGLMNNDVELEPTNNNLKTKDVFKVGHFLVYIGDEHRRFVVNTKLLKHHKFLELLEKSAQEYDYKYNIGLVIPCTVKYFEHLLKQIKLEMAI